MKLHEETVNWKTIKVFTTLEERLNKIHNNKYEYSKSIYKCSRCKIIITCPTHGDFEKLVEQHLEGAGCPECSRNKASDKLRFTTEHFIAKAKEVHGELYDYSKANYRQTKLSITITCPIHGEFKQTPHIHLQGSGCVKCRDANLSDTTKSFIAKAVIVHGNVYDYSKVVYTKSWNKVTIVCPICGVFQQTASNHLAGKGCNTCKGCGFNKSKPAILYYLSINNGQAYKIGITNRTIEERFRSDMAYITVLQQTEYLLGKDAYDEEQRILKEFKEFQYIGPNLLKVGNTELFTADILGYDQAHMITLPNNADLPTILAKLATLQE